MQRKSGAIAGGVMAAAGVIAPMVLHDSIKRDAFVAYVRQALVPDLSPGDIVIMDKSVEPQGSRCAWGDRRG